MADPMRRVAEIRAELIRLAPCPTADDDDLTAVKVARYLAMEAQVIWARMTSMDWPITPAEIGNLTAHFTAAHALLALDAVNAVAAYQTAAEIVNAWEDGGGVGEWLWEHHGGNAQRIADLTAELAAVTPQTCGRCRWGVVDEPGCNCGAPGPNGEHQPECGAAPCPNGCWDKVHPGGES